MDIRKALYFKNREEWRNWLNKNSSKETEVWLLHYKKHTVKPSVSLSEAVEEAICFGWIDSKLKRIDSERFILRYSPRRKGSVWSLLNKKKAGKMIEIGMMTASGLSTVEEAKRNGMWQKAYTNLKKNRLPTDLKKALMTKPKAWENFQKFANSYRNMYIGWVTGAKTEPTRKKRIKEVVLRSALNKKPGIL